MMSDEIARKVLRYRHYCESKESQGLKCHITLEQYLETEYAGDAYGSCGSVWEYTVRALDERELVYDVTGDWWVRTAPVFEKI